MKKSTHRSTPGLRVQSHLRAGYQDGDDIITPNPDRDISIPVRFGTFIPGFGTFIPGTSQEERSDD